MKPTAVLVNTARGPVVDEDALVDALEAGTIFAAGLDVYDGEPAVNPRLLSAPRTTLLPHIGSATIATRTRMGQLACQGVVDVLAGRTPPTSSFLRRRPESTDRSFRGHNAPVNLRGPSDTIDRSSESFLPWRGGGGHGHGPRTDPDRALDRDGRCPLWGARQPDRHSAGRRNHTKLADDRQLSPTRERLAVSCAPDPSSTSSATCVAVGDDGGTWPPSS